MSLSCPRVITATLAVVIAVSVSACNRDKVSQAVDSSTAKPSTEIAPRTTVANTGWNETEAGPVLLLSLPEAVNQAHIVLPFTIDSTSTRADAQRTDSIRGSEFDLFDRTGKVGRVALESVADVASAEGCSSWPLSTFAQPPSRALRVGFIYPAAQAVPLDSLYAVP